MDKIHEIASDQFCLYDFPEELLVPIFSYLDLGNNPLKFYALKLSCHKFVRIFDSHWEIYESIYGLNFGSPSSTVKIYSPFELIEMRRQLNVNSEGKSVSLMSDDKISTLEKKDKIKRFLSVDLLKQIQQPENKFNIALYEGHSKMIRKFPRDHPDFFDSLKRTPVGMLPIEIQRHIINRSDVLMKALCESWYSNEQKRILAPSEWLTWPQGRTPLHMACFLGVYDMVKMLLQANSNLYACEKMYGQTPLHIASQKGFLDIVKLLVIHNRIETGIKHAEYIRFRDKDGYSAWDLAHRYGVGQVEQYLNRALDGIVYDIHEDKI